MLMVDDLTPIVMTIGIRIDNIFLEIIRFLLETIQIMIVDDGVTSARITWVLMLMKQMLKLKW